MRSNPRETGKAIKPNKAQPNNYPEHAIDAGMPGTRGTNVLQKKQCAHCQKRGHYSTQCYFKRMSEVSIGDNEDLDHAFLDNITKSHGLLPSEWMVKALTSSLTQEQK